MSVVPVDARASAYEASNGDGHFTSELRTVRTPLGSTTTYNRDAAGRPSSVVLPWGAQKTYAYTDADTLPETVTLQQGTTLSYAYDSAKREVSRTSSAGESRSFVYGAGDQLLSMTDATGTTRYSYDTLGRFAGITYPHGGSVSYRRDLLGRVIRQEVRATATAEAKVTQYAYDAVGNLLEVVDPLGGSTTFEYDAENRLVERELPNGVVRTYTYDLRDRPLSVVHTNAGGSVLASRTYVRAPGGEPTRITKEDGAYVLVGYDGALRIVSERYFDALNTLEEEISYAYDADGNRTSKTVNGVVSTYAYASGGRILSAGSSGYGNDNAGRVTSMTRADATFVLTYDSDDHLRSVVKDGVSTSYGFDAIGRRTSVSTGASTRRYLVAPNMGAGFESPQVVTDGAGAEVASFVFAGEHPIMRIESGEPVYYLQDSMGSVIGTADDAGGVVDTLDYDGFGLARGAEAESASTLGEFGFQGMWRDPSGLYYVRARTYEPETGRFTSRDPFPGAVSKPESVAPYAFANSNPRRMRDPTGLFSLTELSTVSFAIGVMVGIALPSFTGYSRTARGVASASQIVGGNGSARSGAGSLLEQLRSLDPSQPLPAYLMSAIFAGAGAGSASPIHGLLGHAGALGSGGSTLGAGTALGEVLIPLLAGVAVGVVIGELVNRVADDYVNDEPTEQECQEELAEAERICSGYLEDWERAPPGVRGPVPNLRSCVLGLVSEACGGSPTGNPRPDLPLN